MANYWDENNDESFRDGQDDDQVASHEFRQAPAPRPQRQAPAPVPQEVQDVADQYAQGPAEDEDDYTDVLSDARLRLEQGRLYELLMNHNLFDGVVADTRAIKNVQREIRQYAKERMEIMLGMRAPVAITEKSGGEFNEVEVSVLKMLAKAASKGKTEAPAPGREGLAPITHAKPAPQQVMRPMAPTSQPAPTPQVKKAAPAPPKPLPKAPQRPLDRKRNDVIEQIAREEGVSREDLEESYKPLDKDPSQMTEEEKISRNAQIAKRLRKQVQSSSAKPMPSYDQQAMQYAAQAAEVASSGPMSMLIAAVSKKKN